VADALHYAHGEGVIHRDIKPENILIHNGRPMVADFGIALAVSAAAGGRMTETGLSLGTPHYMSPEQATAEKEITARSDIYSLGSMLYEMLTGDPPHTGSSAQQIIMKIVTEEAQPLTELRKSVPPNVAAATAKALEKLPADRFVSAKAFADALADHSFSSSSVATAGTPSAITRFPVRSAQAGWVVAGVVTLALIWSLLGRAEDAGLTTQFAFSLGAEVGGVPDIDISRDGRRIVQFQSPTGVEAGLAVRHLAAVDPVMIAGVWGGAPRFSPDGRWLAWGGAGSGLWKMPSDGGTSELITEECDNADWIDGSTLVCVGRNWGLARVSSSGGTVDVLTEPDTAAGEIGHWAPVALPGGTAVVFTSYRRPVSRIEAYDLRSGDRTVLVENASYARYARSGHLLYVRDDALFGIRFDPKTLRTEGEAVPLLDDVESAPSDAQAAFAISDNGTLVVVRHSEWRVPKELVWVDRSGTERSAYTTPGRYANPRISPDGEKVALTVWSPRRDVWIFDVGRIALTQLTRAEVSSFEPIWTPDGRRVIYTNETPSYDLYQVPVDGSAAPGRVISGVMDQYARDVSPDGATLAYRETWAGSTKSMLMPLDGSAPPVAFGDTTITSGSPQFSPDGQWLVYDAGTGGDRDVFVRRVDGTGGRISVSTNGGQDPRWTRRGREIVYRVGTAVYAADIDLEEEAAGSPHMLFDGPYPNDLSYDATSDGSRFFMIKSVERPEAQPILVITNFFEELKEKVGN